MLEVPGEGIICNKDEIYFGCLCVFHERYSRMPRSFSCLSSKFSRIAQDRTGVSWMQI